MISLVKLTENDKRFLLALVLIVIFVFVVVGYIGLLIERIMKYQGKRASRMMYNVTTTGVIKTSKDFQIFGLKKNTRVFFQQAWLPFCILLVASIILIIYGATRNFDLDIADYKKKGFATILFLWNNDAPRTKVFGIEIISGWPSLKNTPHWEADAWGWYIFVPVLAVVGSWYLVLVQAFIARQFKIYTLSKEAFSPSLEDYQKSKADADAMSLKNKNQIKQTKKVEPTTEPIEGEDDSTLKKL